MSQETKSAAIETYVLSKRFGNLTAASGITLSIPYGQIYSLIGPNGAGKTTLLKMLVGLLSPSEGSAKIADFDIVENPVEAKRQFSFIPDDPTGYDYLTGREFLVFTAKLRELSSSSTKSRIKELMDIFPIEEIIDQKMANYSRGNKQKIVFLAGLIGNPKILIIDEPIVGLDPKSIVIFGKTLHIFAKHGGTVLMSTHILDFAQDYADKIGIISEGKLLHEASISNSTHLEKLYHKYT